ncbi:MULTISPECIES: glycosyltransferase [unclassified Anabaena]|uniref:glycosyltransferase n=1 Tax=unclassified Anabaena TaxID=2619674 RepID=UPI0039C71F85
MNSIKAQLSYLITVSREHFLPAQFLIINLRNKTTSEIVVVGNLNSTEVKLLTALGATYIDENDIDLSRRLPKVTWQQKYKPFGWYKSMFIRHCIDRFMTSNQVVILDAEVFPFANWDEKKFYDPQTGNPRSFYWIPAIRKSDWDYKMYRGAAYLLSFLPECKGIMEYANSSHYKRHISGVVLFSTKNVNELWRRLETNTDLDRNINQLFNHEQDLAFSDHDIYGLAVEYGLFEQTVPTVMHNNLLGWYDNHDDPNFHIFQKDAMWSMCQQYYQYPDANSYYAFMQNMQSKLNKVLPQQEYWNKIDIELINKELDKEKGIKYFAKYEKQLDSTFRRRFSSMYNALELLYSLKTNNINIVEIGTLRDNNKGGGHSTYKFGEYCSKFGGTVHTVDILPEAIEYSMKATGEYQPWIKYYIQDSEIFLNTFSEKIDLLYLDGYDSTPGNENKASLKQLNEIKAALPKLKEKCIVLLDDADLPEGGKAKFSSQFLIDNGFELIIDNYQQLYARGFKKYNDQVSKIDPDTLATLEKLIDNLPEVYQSIYLNGELIREGVRGNDFERLEVIKSYIKPNQTILDIGSNVGFFSINIAKIFPDNVFVSIEKQYHYARLQQELIKLEGVNNIILIHSEVTTEWLLKAIEACTYFDVTLLLSVLHHIQDAEDFLKNLNHISKSFIMELPHPDESRVCGKDVLKQQLTLEKISQVKPVFNKMPYEAKTHCDAHLKRSFYYADSPNYQRESIFPYIGYPLQPRSYLLKADIQGLVIHKSHLNQDIQTIPGVLLSDVAQLGQILMPSYETCIQKIETEFDRLQYIDNVADIRPWNILFTADGLKFIDYQYTKDLDSVLKFNKSRDLDLIKNYLNLIFSVRVKPTIIIDGIFFQLYATGIARVWKSLLQQWANTDFASHILVLDRANTAPQINGIHYLTIPPYDYNNTDADREMLQQVCDQEGADLFISSYYTTPITTPSVFMAYDMIPEVMGWDMNNPMWREKHQAIQAASSYIAISENTAHDLTRCFPDIPRDTVTVAHCGVHAQFSPANPEEINDFKTRYGITKPYFLLVGAGGGYKNSMLFFQAFAQLASSSGFDIILTGIGGVLSPEFRAYTSGSTVHTLQLSDEELAIAYSGAVALVYPSKYEGFGMPIIEAMACGCPVITCANASIPEVAGEAAIYVNDDDVDELANALCEVQKPSFRQALIIAGLVQVQNFSWSKMAETVSSVLVEATLLSLNLKETNLIIFPDWSQPEDALGSELEQVLKVVATHPDSEKTTLLINTNNIAVEDAELFLSSVAMNILMQEDLDITEGLAISLVPDLADIQWEALLPRINGRIILEHEDQNGIIRAKAENITTYELESLIPVRDEQFFFA